MKQFTAPDSVINYSTASTTIVAGDLVMATSAGAPVIGADTAGAKALGMAITDYDDGSVNVVTDGYIFIAADSDTELGGDANIISNNEITTTGDTNEVTIGQVMVYVTSLSDHTELDTQAGAGFVKVKLN